MDRLFDIAVNLADRAFDQDRDAVIERALEAGVSRMLLVGTCLKSSQQAMELAQRYKGHGFATAGVHPHDAKDVQPGHWSELRDLAQAPEVVAIGETGLDFNRDFSPRPIQEQVFERQIELAAELKMPLFCHEREAGQRLYEMLRHHRDALPGAVVHCFTGDRTTLYRYLDLDLYIGITGWVCDERRGTHLHPLLHDIPTDRLLIETDAPYLVPRTLRPKPKKGRNEPAFVTAVLDEIARITGRSSDELARMTWANANRLFALDD